MLRNLRTICYFLCLLATFAGCKSIGDHAPEQIPVEGNLDPLVSTINLPIAIEVQDIEDLVNEKLKGELYNDNSFDKDRLKISVSKIGHIQVAMSGERLHYELPLHIWLEVQMDEKKFLSKVKKSQQLEFSLTLHFSSSLAVDQSWKPVVHTKLEKYEWVKKPTVKVLFLNMPITSVVEKQLDMRMDGLLAKIDAVVHRKLDVKTHVQKLWASLQKPILIEKKHSKVWLHATPTAVAMSRITGHDGLILIYLKINADFKTLFGETPQFVTSDSLPPLLATQDTSTRFSISILSKIPFDQLNNALNEHIPKKEIAFDDYNIKMKAFELSGTDSAVLLRVHVGGAIHGKLYFRGKPHYDAATKTFSLENFDFDVSSEEVLVNTADWVLHSSMHEKLQTELHIAIGPKLEAIPQLIQTAIDNSKVSKKVNIQLRNMTLDLQNMLVTSKNIQIQVVATGHAHLGIERLTP